MAKIDPFEQLQSLDNYLAELLDSGQVHEDKLAEIEQVIERIYSEDIKFFNEQHGFTGEEEGIGLGIFELMEIVDNKKQFLEDYKNTIDLILGSDYYHSQGDLDNAVLEVITMRIMLAGNKT